MVMSGSAEIVETCSFGNKDLIMTSVRNLQQEIPRVETGPIQFGDDWPGVFIRGDACAYYNLLLAEILNKTDLNPITKFQLSGLQKLLARSIIE
jgi:hypothetical protein